MLYVVDVIQASFPRLLRVDVVDLSPDQEVLLIACGHWMRFSLSCISGLPNKLLDRLFDFDSSQIKNEFCFD